MESNTAENAKDKWGIVILHSDSQYELAQAVSDSLRAICLAQNLSVCVEVFADLVQLGTIAIEQWDDVIEYSSILMFFRTKEFFSEDEMNGFGLAAAVEDRISHPESRRKYTIIPLDIDERTRIPKKASINRLCGLIVTSKGDIKGRNTDERIRKMVMKACPLPASPRVDGSPAHMEPSIAENATRPAYMEPSIAENATRQAQQISALVPDGSSQDAPSPTGQTIVEDKAAAEAASHSLSDREIRRASGMDNRPLPRIDGCLSEQALEKPALFEKDSSNSLSNLPALPNSSNCSGKNGSGCDPADNFPAATSNTRPESSPSLSGDASSTQRPSGDETPNEVEVKQANDDTDVRRFSQTAGPAMSDNQRFLPLFPPNHYNATEPRNSRGDEQSCLANDCSQENYFQSDQYWNQKGARPKTSQINSAMSGLPKERRESPFSTNNRHADTQSRRQRTDCYDAERRRIDCCDEEMQKAMADLREISLTPPPSPELQGIDLNAQAHQAFSHNVTSSNLSQPLKYLNASPHSQQPIPTQHLQNSGTDLPQVGLEEDGCMLSSPISSTERSDREGLPCPTHPPHAPVQQDPLRQEAQAGFAELRPSLVPRQSNSLDSSANRDLTDSGKGSIT